MQLGAKFINRANSVVSGMKQEYNSFESHHRELAEQILPRVGRWLTSDTNKGGKKNGKIIDNTAKLALGVLSAGMMSGLTSPARPWFNLQHPDPKIEGKQKVKSWNSAVKDQINSVFSRSNLYDSLPLLYAELGLFGQCPIAVFADVDDVIHTQTFTQGEYWIANNEKGVVERFARSFRMTVGQVVAYSGYENCSSTVQNLYDNSSYDEWVDLYHLVEANSGRDFSKADSISKPFRSVLYEQSSSDRALSFDGFEEFPIFCPRWQVTSNDIYASGCPGMDALGDTKQLQLHEKRSAEAIEKMVRPPMVADPDMRNRHKTQMPGGVTYSTFVNGRPGFQEAYKTDVRINELEAKSEQIRGRINQAFFADLFLMLSSSNRRQITAREVEERHEEKLLMLGPVLERLNKELLDPLIGRTFNIMNEKGLIPEPPRELYNAEIKVEYISVLHQAQRSVGVSAVDRLLGFASEVIAIDPSSKNKVNFGKMIDTYGNMLGTHPNLIRSDEDAAAITAQEQEQQANVANTEMAMQAAKPIKDLIETKPESDNALSTILNQVAA
jgi:hypothetical protein